MTDIEFKIGVGRLTKVYGEQSYPPERLEIIFKKTKVLESSEWHDVVTEIIGSQKFAPLSDKIQEIAAPHLRRAWARLAAHQTQMLAERSKNGMTCRYCGDSGLISALKKESGASFAFRCPEISCLAASMKCNTSDVRWIDSYSEFYLPRFISSNDWEEHFEKSSPELFKSIEEQSSKNKSRLSDFERVARKAKNGKLRLEEKNEFEGAQK